MTFDQCPACGSPKLYLVEHEYVGDTGTPHREFYIECNACKCRAASGRTSEEAVSHWKQDCNEYLAKRQENDVTEDES